MTMQRMISCSLNVKVISQYVQILYNLIEILSFSVYVLLKKKKKLNHTVKPNPLECIFLMGTGLLYIP